MLSVKYWRICCDVISLLAQVIIVSFDRAYKNILKISMFQFLWYDYTFKKQCTVPVTLTLTYKGKKCVITHLITTQKRVMYEFQIDISTNSR